MKKSLKIQYTHSSHVSLKLAYIKSKLIGITRKITLKIPDELIRTNMTPNERNLPTKLPTLLKWDKLNPRLNLLDKNLNLAILIGGFEEAALTDFGKYNLYLKNNANYRRCFKFLRTILNYIEYLEKHVD